MSSSILKKSSFNSLQLYFLVNSDISTIKSLENINIVKVFQELLLNFPNNENSKKPLEMKINNFLNENSNYFKELDSDIENIDLKSRVSQNCLIFISELLSNNELIYESINNRKIINLIHFIIYIHDFLLKQNQSVHQTLDLIYLLLLIVKNQKNIYSDILNNCLFILLQSFLKQFLTISSNIEYIPNSIFLTISKNPYSYNEIISKSIFIITNFINEIQSEIFQLSFIEIILLLQLPQTIKNSSKLLTILINLTNQSKYSNYIQNFEEKSPISLLETILVWVLSNSSKLNNLPKTIIYQRNINFALKTIEIIINKIPYIYYSFSNSKGRELLANFILCSIEKELLINFIEIEGYFKLILDSIDEFLNNLEFEKLIQTLCLFFSENINIIKLSISIKNQCLIKKNKLFIFTKSIIQNANNGKLMFFEKFEEIIDFFNNSYSLIKDLNEKINILINFIILWNKNYEFLTEIQIFKFKNCVCEIIIYDEILEKLLNNENFCKFWIEKVIWIENLEIFEEKIFKISTIKKNYLFFEQIFIYLKEIDYFEQEKKIIYLLELLKKMLIFKNNLFKNVFFLQFCVNKMKIFEILTKILAKLKKIDFMKKVLNFTYEFLEEIEIKRYYLSIEYEKFYLNLLTNFKSEELFLMNNILTLGSSLINSPNIKAFLLRLFLEGLLVNSISVENKINMIKIMKEAIFSNDFEAYIINSDYFWNLLLKNLSISNNENLSHVFYNLLYGLRNINIKPSKLKNLLEFVIKPETQTTIKKLISELFLIGIKDKSYSNGIYFNEKSNVFIESQINLPSEFSFLFQMKIDEKNISTNNIFKFFSLKSSWELSLFLTNENNFSLKLEYFKDKILTKYDIFHTQLKTKILYNIVLQTKNSGIEIYINKEPAQSENKTNFKDNLKEFKNLKISIGNNFIGYFSNILLIKKKLEPNELLNLYFKDQYPDKSYILMNISQILNKFNQYNSQDSSMKLIMSGKKEKSENLFESFFNINLKNNEIEEKKIMNIYIKKLIILNNNSFLYAFNCLQPLKILYFVIDSIVYQNIIINQKLYLIEIFIEIIHFCISENSENYNFFFIDNGIEIYRNVLKNIVQNSGFNQIIFSKLENFLKEINNDSDKKKFFFRLYADFTIFSTLENNLFQDLSDKILYFMLNIENQYITKELWIPHFLKSIDFLDYKKQTILSNMMGILIGKKAEDNELGLIQESIEKNNFNLEIKLKIYRKFLVSNQRNSSFLIEKLNFFSEFAAKTKNYQSLSIKTILLEILLECFLGIYLPSSNEILNEIDSSFILKIDNFLPFVLTPEIVHFLLTFLWISFEKILDIENKIFDILLKRDFDFSLLSLFLLEKNQNMPLIFTQLSVYPNFPKLFVKLISNNLNKKLISYFEKLFIFLLENSENPNELFEKISIFLINQQNINFLNILDGVLNFLIECDSNALNKFIKNFVIFFYNYHVLMEIYINKNLFIENLIIILEKMIRIFDKMELLYSTCFNFNLAIPYFSIEEFPVKIHDLFYQVKQGGIFLSINGLLLKSLAYGVKDPNLNIKINKILIQMFKNDNLKQLIEEQSVNYHNYFILEKEFTKSHIKKCISFVLESIYFYILQYIIRFPGIETKKSLLSYLKKQELLLNIDIDNRVSKFDHNKWNLKFEFYLEHGFITFNEELLTKEFFEETNEYDTLFNDENPLDSEIFHLNLKEVDCDSLNEILSKNSKSKKMIDNLIITLYMKYYRIHKLMIDFGVIYLIKNSGYFNIKNSETDGFVSIPIIYEPILEFEISNKITLEFNKIKNEMTTFKGPFYTPKENIIYKISKLSDSQLRRFFLKPKKLLNTNEKIHTESISSKHQSTSLSPSKLSQAIFESPLKAFGAGSEQEIKDILYSETLFSSQKNIKETRTISEFNFNNNFDKDKNNFKWLGKVFNKKKLNFEFWAERIKLEGGWFGKLYLDKKKLKFLSLNEKRHDLNHKFGQLEENLLSTNKINSILLNNIESIFLRSFNQILNSFEIFTKQGRSYFFLLYTRKHLTDFLNKIGEYQPNLFISLKRKERFEKIGIQKKWIEGNIGNFEYLMMLNNYAGRSFNDGNQYPIFPWILNDYSTDSIDFSSSNIRKLEKPVGALDSKRLEYFKNRMKSLDFPHDDNMKPFLYGTHYSGTGPLLYYMVRLDPFAGLCWKLQSGHFDIADRLFRSISETWISCLTHTSDVKELIPEFFYFPDFLRNKNKFDFGLTQNKMKVNDVEIPKWADSPEEFIFRHRQFLESPLIDENLHHWIDLIFGYKQKGIEAIKSDNVFYQYTYEGEANLEKINNKDDLKGVLTQIANFGQTPHQMFIVQHPKKKDLKKLSFPEHKIIDPIFTKLNVSKIKIINFKFNFNFGMFCLFEDFSYTILPLKIFCLAKNQSFKNNYVSKNINIQIDSEMNSKPIIYMFKNPTQFEFMFIIAGFCDNTIRIFNCGKEIYRIRETNEIIEFSYSEVSKIIVIALHNYIITLWNLDSVQKFGKKIINIYGHYGLIKTIKINEVIKIFVSLDENGLILCHSLQDYQCLFRIHLIDFNGLSLEIHDYGVLTIISKEGNLYSFNLNGEKIKELENKYGLNIIQSEFFGKNSSILILADINGHFYFYDIFSMELKNKIKRSKDNDLNLIYFIYNEDLNLIISSFENGQIEILTLNKLFDELAKMDSIISELGIE